MHDALCATYYMDAQRNYPSHEVSQNMEYAMFYTFQEIMSTLPIELLYRGGGGFGWRGHVINSLVMYKCMHGYLHVNKNYVWFQWTLLTTGEEACTENWPGHWRCTKIILIIYSLAVEEPTNYEHF